MSIDFEIPAEAKAIREKVRKFVHDECIPAEKELDTKPLAEVLAPLRKKARAQGLSAASAGTVEETLRFLCARDWATPPRIVIGGSLYLAGEVLRVDGTLPR
jgi:folylpolyglutamate synthase/dihydropteroate synthase